MNRGRQIKLACDKDPQAIGLVGQQKAIPVVKDLFKAEYLRQEDCWLKLRDGSYLFVEIKTKAKMVYDVKTGFYWTGYNNWQYIKDLSMYNTLKIRTVLFIQHNDSGRKLWQYIDVLKNKEYKYFQGNNIIAWRDIAFEEVV